VLSEREWLRLLDPRRERADEDALDGHTTESLEVLAELLAHYRSAVTSALVERVRDECPGEAPDVQCYEGEHQSAVLENAPAVCQVLLDRGTGEFKPRGTAVFALAPDLILTAGHVVPEDWTPDGPVRLAVRFGFERDCDGRLADTNDFPIVDVLELFRTGLDFGILRAGDDPRGKSPGDIAPTIDLGNSGALQIDDPVICIQHPMGDAKRVSIGGVRDRQDSHILYDNFTASRSSGSPILDRTGQLVGVHRRHYPDRQCIRLGVSIDAIVAASEVL
jgi:hypothetical protein